MLFQAGIWLIGRPTWYFERPAPTPRGHSSGIAGPGDLSRRNPPDSWRYSPLPPDGCKSIMTLYDSQLHGRHSLNA
jgi:hypothetical protein